MSKSLYVKITNTQSLGPYAIYYDAVSAANFAFFYGTTTETENIPVTLLVEGSGVRVTVPSSATKIILQNANGDCHNYKDFSIAPPTPTTAPPTTAPPTTTLFPPVVFTSVTTACVLYYDGSGQIVINITGGSGLYQYSIDDGVTYTASTSNLSATFNNQPNKVGGYKIKVKSVTDNRVFAYPSNPVNLNCAPKFVASQTSNCDQNGYGAILFSASGGSGTYQYSITDRTTGQVFPKQSFLAFTNLDGTHSFDTYAYDSGNPIPELANSPVYTGQVDFACVQPTPTTLNPPIVVTATFTCSNDNTANVTLAATGGVGSPYEYAMTTSISDVPVYQNSNLFTNKSAPTGGINYYLWAKDANGKQGTGIKNITCAAVPPPPITFTSVTSVCDLYYVGSGKITINVSGGTGVYQYSIDNGTTFTSSTTNATFSFTNLANGTYNIKAKSIGDNVIYTYGSNPVTIACAADFTATKFSSCAQNGTGTITVSASGGSGTYQYSLQNVTTGAVIPKQSLNVFGGLNGLNTYDVYAYDVGNTVNPNYQIYVGQVVFNCPQPTTAPPTLAPLSVTATAGCAPSGISGTGRLTAGSFSGGTGIYVYAAYGSSESNAISNVRNPSARITLSGALSYTWQNLANGPYFVAIQDSRGNGYEDVSNGVTISCTSTEAPHQQFLVYNLATNTCANTGTATRYWTYNMSLTTGYYRLNGSTTRVKIESAAPITDRGTQITSSVADNCLTSTVRLTPFNDVPPSAYTLFVNDVPYPDFDEGERSYPVGSVIKLVYDGVNNVCGVVLNDTAYVSSTNVTLVNGVSYTFKLYNYNFWSNAGTTYCSNNKTFQPQANACGNTRQVEVFPCSTKCTATTFTDVCTGDYGQNVTRTFYYACNGQATGTVTQLTCGGTCTSVAQDWEVTATYCKPGFCNLFNEETQSNPCAPNPGSTREVALQTNSCDCGETCAGTYSTSTCDPNNPGTQITVVRYTCFPNSVVSSTSTSCVEACGANTSQNWVNEGAVFCSSCIKKQTQRQLNPCAPGYNTTRVVDATDGNTTCECGEECKGTETYNFCSGTQGKSYYSVQRYVCPPNSYTTTPQLVGTCLVGTCGVTTTPQYDAKGYNACYSGAGYPCTTGPVFQDINYCSSTYNNYFIEVSGNKINVGGQPTQGACNTTENWVDTGAVRCSSTCVNEKQQQQQNPCATGYNTTRWVSNPGGTSCNTTPNWVDTGAVRCFECANQKEQQQTNPCASGTIRWVSNPSGTSCNYNANYSDLVGNIYSCSGGVISATPVYENSNLCFTASNQWQAGGTTYTADPSQPYPNTDPICLDEGAPYCIEPNIVVNLYQANPCSTGTCPPYRITIPNGCAPACKTYNWSCNNGFGVNCNITSTRCDGSSYNDSVPDNSSGSVCAQTGAFAIDNGGSYTEGGTCS
jgi:hypothetical protein